MTWIAVAVVGGSLITGAMSSSAQKDAANTAASAQSQSAAAGIAEQRRQFDRIQQLLSPFVQAATGVPMGGYSAPSVGGYPSAPAGQTPGQAPSQGGTTYTTPTSFPQQWSGFGGTDVSWQSDPTLSSQSDPNWHPPTFYNPNYNPADISTANGIPMSAFTKPADAGVAQQQTLASPGGPTAQSTMPAGMAGAGGQGGDTGIGGSLGAQMALAGINGPDAQQAMVDQIKSMPAFQSQLTLGENRLLQNASATGGLRGGNTQGALAWFAPSLLAQQINNQYSMLGGLTSIGQNAAAMVGNAGMATGQGVSGLLQQQGSAAAGAALAGGRAQSNLYSSFNGALGQYIGGGGGFGGGFNPGAMQGAVAQTGVGSSGFGTGLAYGNQDYGQFI